MTPKASKSTKVTKATKTTKATKKTKTAEDSGKTPDAVVRPEEVQDPEVARPSGGPKAIQVADRVPQSATLSRFFGGTSERVPVGISPGGRGQDSVARADYIFLQGAYEGVQEQNVRLTKLLENLSDSHARVLLERESSENETKRLREVRCMSPSRFRFSVCHLNHDSTKLFHTSESRLDDFFATPRTENSFIAAESTGS